MIHIQLKTQEYPTYDNLISLLVEYHYARSPMVIEPGEFTVKGGIIDIFPVNQTHPIRIEYFDNDIDRLTSFDVQTQRSLSVLTETEISKNTEDHHAFLQEQDIIPNLPEIISQFSEGDYIVHEDYGVGLFKGLGRQKFGSLEGEYIKLHFKGEDKVFIPLNQLNRIHRYDDETTPTLSSLHDDKWRKATQKALEHTQKIAAHIYETYKKRLSRQGFVYAEDTEDQVRLESEFKYTLTKDQETAIRDIKEDMESPKPMERLICGDVGFGKTEVVLRAAFKALENMKQVVLLCPTTILAQQHFHTFESRFKKYGYKVKMLSRLVKKENQKNILDGLKKHTVDMIIGTHRVLQKDISFSDLGLLIVDEEQRFGVKHKERIKELKLYVDIISVSATPIPRTLSMALNGAKDVSIINTPPKKRKPIVCTICQYDTNLIKKSIEREIERRGQVFFVHNRVRDIQTIKKKLHDILPQLSIEIAHGQMDESKMISVMNKFISGKCHILLCTTIIENGMDIPNANTIIINHADKFGLSQIHQLRGRVGRSEKQAYAYMLYDSIDTLTDDAKKRLRAVKEYLSLGSGYQLALKDLEIRGAGNLLGKEQSGHLKTIGFTLYCKLLENAIRHEKHETLEANHWIGLETNHIRIDESYISNPRERLAVYNRMMKLNTQKELDALISEIRDRYGPYDNKIHNVFEYIKRNL